MPRFHLASPARRLMAGAGLMIVTLSVSLGQARAADAAPAAANKGAKPTLNGGKANGVLTRDQLRQCLSQQKSLKEGDEGIARSQAELDTQKAEITRQRADFDKQTADLEAERASVDLSKQDAVDAFNAKLSQRSETADKQNVLIEDYNAKVAALKTRFEALDGTRKTWTAECGNRSYDELDYYAIQRGK